ncbi:MAG: OmpH family outer membrane protein, partial [Phycisphaeraceae bacterium]|nr:OmpH family outer membrane protein [Phycisphaeraceae bacterium]
RKFDAKKKQIGDKPNDAQKKELMEMQRKFQIQMSQARSKANKVLNDYRTKVNRQFREEVRPVAMEIAKDRGASIVLMHDPKRPGPVFGMEPTVNITDQVVLTLLQQRNAEQPKSPGAGSPRPPSPEPTGKSESNGPEAPRFEVPDIQDPTVPDKPAPKTE